MSELYCKRCDDYRPCKCDQAEAYAKEIAELENKVEELEKALALQKENAFEAWRLADYWRGAHAMARQKLKDIYNGTDLVDEMSVVVKTSTDNNKCIWTQESDPEVFPDLWRTNCENSFYLDAALPSDNHMKYCCYCGKPIIETDNNKLVEGGD